MGWDDLSGEVAELFAVDEVHDRVAVHPRTLRRAALALERAEAVARSRGLARSATTSRLCGCGCGRIVLLRMSGTGRQPEYASRQCSQRARDARRRSPQKSAARVQEASR